MVNRKAARVEPSIGAWAGRCVLDPLRGQALDLCERLPGKELVPPELPDAESVEQLVLWIRTDRDLVQIGKAGLAAYDATNNVGS